MDNYVPVGIFFYDNASGRSMCLVTEGTYEGWLAYQLRWAGGGWVTLRVATDADKAAIQGAGHGRTQTL